MWGKGTLLLIERAEVLTGADGKQTVKPLLEDVDRIQALPVTASLYQQPAIEVVSYGESGGQAIVMLEDGKLSFFQVNDPGYSAPTLRLNAAVNTTNYMLGYQDSGEVILRGESSLLKGDLGTADPLRYVVVEQGGVAQAILPVGKSIRLIGATEEIAVVEGLSELGTGTYDITGHNSHHATARTPVRVVDAYKIQSTNLDHRANQSCGIMPSTISGMMYPGKFAVKVDALPADKLETVQLRRSDGLTYDVSGVTRTSGGEVNFQIPPDIATGDYKLAMKADGYWREGKMNWWKVTRDASACQLAEAKTIEVPTQADDTSFYLGAWPGYAAGSQTLTLYGKGFNLLGGVKSIAITQGSSKTWAAKTQVNGNNQVVATFEGLDRTLKQGEEIGIEIYNEAKDEVSVVGAQPLGRVMSWRRAASGLPASIPTPEITNLSNEEPVPGESLKIECSGCAFPGPKFTEVEIKGPSGKTRRLPAVIETAEWAKETQTNTKATLVVNLPNDLLTLSASIRVAETSKGSGATVNTGKGSEYSVALVGRTPGAGIPAKQVAGRSRSFRPKTPGGGSPDGTCLPTLPEGKSYYLFIYDKYEQGLGSQQIAPTQHEWAIGPEIDEDVRNEINRGAGGKDISATFYTRGDWASEFIVQITQDNGFSGLTPFCKTCHNFIRDYAIIHNMFGVGINEDWTKSKYLSEVRVYSKETMRYIRDMQITGYNFEYAMARQAYNGPWFYSPMRFVGHSLNVSKWKYKRLEDDTIANGGWPVYDLGILTSYTLRDDIPVYVNKPCY